MKRYEGSPAVVIERRKGTLDSPFSNMNESLVVTGDGKVLLSEIPNELNRVIVTSEGNTTWYEVTEGRVPENGFKVDYINKLVTFNTVHVGKQLNFKYLGEGNHFYSPHSIYTKLEENTVVETLGDIVEGGKDALDALGALNEKLDEVTQVTNNAITATNDTKDVIQRGEQVIVDAKSKVNELDNKIVILDDKLLTTDTKLNEVNEALLEVDNTIQTANQSISNINDAIEEAVQTTANAQLLIDEAKSVGEFVLSKQYKKNNTVLNNGSTWIALQDTINNPLPVLPIRENEYWRLVAQRGIDGTGSVVTVNGVSPDVDGNVPLTVQDIGAITQSELNNSENSILAFINEHGIGASSAKDITPPSELFNLSESGFYNVIYQQGDNTMPDETEDYHTYVGFSKKTDVITEFYFAISKSTGKTYTRSRSKTLNVIINDSNWIEGGGSGSDTGGSFTKTIPYFLPTTVENQKSWKLPTSSYDANNDSIIVFHNGIYLPSNSWNLSGDKLNGYTLNIPDNPMILIEDNHVNIIILKNLPSDGTERFSGNLIEDGTIPLEKLSQDLQENIKTVSGSLGNSYLEAYTLQTIIENQKTWDVPLDTYDAETDTMLIYHNTGLLDKESWTLTGDAGNGYKVNIPDNPEAAIADNNVIIVVLRNAPSVPNGVDISGTRITDGSVALAKLSQDVQDKINKVVTNIVIDPVFPENDPTHYPIGISIFTVPPTNEYDVWLIYFGIDKIDTTVYTNLQVRTYRISGYDAIQELIVMDVNGKVKYISQRTSINSPNQTFEKPSIIYGTPSVQIVNDLTTGGTDKVASAETVKMLKSEIDRSLKVDIYNANSKIFNNNQSYAVRTFDRIMFAKNDKSEQVIVSFPLINFEGMMKVTLTSTYGSSDASGGGEYIFHFLKPIDNNYLKNEMNIVSLSPSFAENFFVFLAPRGSGQNPFLIIDKKLRNNPLNMTIEFYTSTSTGSFATSAFNILNSTTVSVVEHENNISFTPQQSIFTHVGNSKQDLATAITGKGVPTSANAMFAQMVANINAIPSGVPYYRETGAPASTSKFFAYANGSGGVTVPYYAVTIPFQPQIVVLEGYNLGYTTVSTFNADNLLSTFGGNLVVVSTNTTNSATGYHMRGNVINNGNGTWTIEIPIWERNTHHVYAYGKV